MLTLGRVQFTRLLGPLKDIMAAADQGRSGAAAAAAGRRGRGASRRVAPGTTLRGERENGSGAGRGRVCASE